MADKILSYLVANNISYCNLSNIIIFKLKNNNKNVDIYYYKNKFFIDCKDYNGQPHIITHWNLNNDKNKFGLCLTMDGNDRRENVLNAIGQIKRVKEIVFELWDDPIGERFRELNVSLQTTMHNSFYLSFDGKIKILNSLFNIDDEFNIDDVEFISIKYNGEQKKDILNNNKIINSNKKFKLITIKYKKHIKKIFLFNNNMFKINDFSPNSFWERIIMKKVQKRNIKIIGLGSIGGLVLDYICKSGYYDNLEIYDYDNMEVVNNPRHVLGISASEINILKTLHLFKHYSKCFPMLKIKCNNIFDYSKDKIVNNDLIFDTTGGSISKMKENFLKLCDKNKNKNFTYINIFTEPFALGVHCIVINCKKQKPNLKFIEKLDLEERYIVTNKKDFRINFDGCFTPSLPYGFAPLQISIPLFISKIIKNNFENNHYTIPFLSIIPYKKEYINKKMSNDIFPNELKLKIWEK